jgi:recombination protein RecT
LSNLPATTAKEKSQTLMNVLQARKDIFKDLLPKYLTAEKLFRVAQLAMSKNPALLACTPASFVVAMMDAAKSGLEPNGKDGALVSYGQDCQFQPMFQGMIKQAVSGGAAKKIFARIVYANDKFRLKYDPEPHIEHEPAYDDEGEVVGAYAYAVLPDDSLHVEYMNKRQLDHIKAKSKARSGPWTTDPEEMYRKTPVKRLFKYLPVPDEVEYAVQVDNLAENGRSRNDIPLLDKAPDDLKVPQTEGIKEKLKQSKKTASPEAGGEEIPGNEGNTIDPNPETPLEGATESQGPDLGEVLTQLTAKGWPVKRLEVKFNKPAKDWGEHELSVLADMAAE